jgi:importin-9
VLRDPRIESLMVIGYNPSHSNVNSEVNTPFKILSLMLRYLENESTHHKKPSAVPSSYEDDEDEEEKSGITPGFKMRRDLFGDGERLDTVEGDDEENYDLDGDDKNKDKAKADNKIEVNLDDVEDDDDNESLLGRGSSTTGGANSGSNNLFTIKESHDRGLADMETGSEVYMSELLVRIKSH